MIATYKNKHQNSVFYAIMGEYFSDLDIAKELGRQVYNKANSVWFISSNNDGSVYGFAAIFDNGKYYFLDNLYVLPDFRNGGIAKEIITKIVTEFDDKPIRCVANNPYALKIFRSLGFVEVGQNGKYKKLIKH